MKTLNIYAALLFSIFAINFSFAQKTNVLDRKENIKVWGNCETCKKHIETASLSAGAKTANWNTQSKILAVTYDGAKTSSTKIQQAIAASGYDTPNFKGDDNAYNKLASCCQYERSTGTTLIEKSMSKMDCQKMAGCMEKACGKNDKCDDKTCKKMAECKDMGCCKS
ncbi:MAG TPA: heavy metal-associated domain-containing protein [Chitinophagaceae bacterium]